MYVDRPEVADSEPASLAALNTPRRIRLQTALAKLRGAIVFPGIRRNEDSIRDGLARIDALDLDAVEAAIKLARTTCSVERPALHTARIDRIAALIHDAHATCIAAIVDGQRGADPTSTHGRALAAAHDKLALITW